MTVAEFNRAAGAYQKRTMVAVLVLFGTALMCVFGYASFQHRFESFLASRVNGAAAEVLSVLPMAVPTALAFCILIPLTRRIDRQSGLSCPHCLKTLATYKHIVIASRNCPYCGKKVIEDETNEG